MGLGEAQGEYAYKRSRESLMAAPSNSMSHMIGTPPPRVGLGPILALQHQGKREGGLLKRWLLYSSQSFQKASWMMKGIGESHISGLSFTYACKMASFCSAGIVETRSHPTEA